MHQKNQPDYRVNLNQEGEILSIEIKCCGRHIGEMRYKNNQNVKCPVCGAIHTLRVQYNHFHLGQEKIKNG